MWFPDYGYWLVSRLWLLLGFPIAIVVQFSDRDSCGFSPIIRTGRFSPSPGVIWRKYCISFLLSPEELFYLLEAERRSIYWSWPSDLFYCAVSHSRRPLCSVASVPLTSSSHVTCIIWHDNGKRISTVLHNAVLAAWLRHNVSPCHHLHKWRQKPPFTYQVRWN